MILASLDPVWLFLLTPFVGGAIIGAAAGYIVRADRASREAWAADQRAAEWRRDLVRAQRPRPYPARHRRPRPYRAPTAAPVAP